MQSRLKKTLYLGLAAISLGAITAISTTDASAKSYATAGAYKALTTDATKRNVEATGTNALYTKPGTVKGAKVVASKATMATLASSKKSGDYFRAYGVKTTNRGSVYYRVVTMDGKYRGYVYGGTVDTAFAGGLKSAETMTKVDLPKETTVYFKTPGKKNVTWDAPYQTQYKASKMVTDTTPFATDKLTITDAAKKTREGTLYYYVKDATNPSVSGWIYSEAVTGNTAGVYNQTTDIQVNFVATNGTTIKTATLAKLIANNATNTAKGDTAAKVKGTAVGFDAKGQATTVWGTALLKGTGYDYNADTASNQAALLGAKTGDTISLTVTKGAQAVQSISAYYQDGVNNPVKLSSAAATTDANLVYQVTFPKLTAAFTGSKGANYTAADVQNFLTTNKANTLTSVDYAKDAKGNIVKTTDANALGVDGKVVSATNKVQVYHTVYTLTSGVAGTYTTNGTASAFYSTAKEVKGSGVTTTNTGNVSVFG